MDALRHSIVQEQGASARPAKGRKHIDGQAEMLLPIAGKARRLPRQRHDSPEHPPDEARLIGAKAVAPTASLP